ncbi:diaminopimelate epimerase [Candidatus Halobeggiatoa sp. HSG11]|nr:diaminopimelate epimerase [Candidatus Halobeggiatoa sp. HSG11]
MQFNILKCHGSGNDFILINEYEELLFTEQQRVILSKLFCNRNGILGADGILFFQNSKTADGKMRIFNSDGSEAEICGNGLRCVGRFACELFNKNSVLIETLKGFSQVIKDTNIYQSIPTYQAELNIISLASKDIPILIDSDTLINQPLFTNDLLLTAVSMPNPHLVAIVNDINDSELEKIGKLANQLPNKIPDGTNVNFCKIIDSNSIYVRTYERGVGLTNSCGSGMSASTLVTCLLGYNSFNEPINVYNHGGLVICTPKLIKKDKYSVFLSGNATFVLSNSIKFEFSNLDNIIQYFEKVFVDEIQNYGRFIEYSTQFQGKLI